MKKILTAMFVCGLCASFVQAALITDSSSITGTTTVISFSGITGTGVTTPVNLGYGVTVAGTAGGLYFNWNGWGLNDNGSWNTGRDGYVGINDSGVTTFSFTDPVSQVGAFMNYSPLYACTISVLGNSGQVLESYDLSTAAPISTPGGVNAGAFRGISRTAADIYGFRMNTGYPVADNLTFSQAIPEPASALLIAAGAVIVLLKRRFFGLS